VVIRNKWKTVPLGDYCSKIGSGSTPRGGDSVYQESGVSFIRSQNIYNGQFVTDGLAHLNDELANKLRGVTVEPNDVLLNITGDSVARSCQVPEEILPARVNQHVAIVRPKAEEFDSRFVAYFLISPFMQSTMLSLAGSGGTRKALTKEMIERFKVPHPRLPLQERISDFLSTYDNLIDNNRQRMALLEESARQLYLEWFVRMHFPGHEHTSITNGVPVGWKRKKLGEICEDIREKVLPNQLEPDTPYIGLEHIPKRSISLTDWGQAEQVTSTKHRFRAGEFLFGKIRPYFHKVGVAFVDGVASADAIVIRPQTASIGGLVLMTISSDAFVAATAQGMKEGSKMPRADWKLMKQYPILVPPDGLLSTFQSTIQLTVAQLKTLTLQNQKLRAARDLLLPKLMSGEIAV
jgi:type I restriction enzyme, S subunit